ncbi:PLP-dependent aminotransferase family protein [Candidatus Gottesmanbacteria bacterium]|nr:PLP-dependent aminotransferase family protein [Candidatus Gottesmanbacteria bacterium]
MGIELAQRAERFARPNPLGRVLTQIAEMQRQGIPVISFAGGLPPNEVVQAPGPAARDIGEISSRVLHDATLSRTALQYSGSEGYLPLREWLADKVSKDTGQTTSPENILITNGLQEGLEKAAYTLCDPGDVILMEPLSYGGALSAFAIPDGVECWGLPTDSEGIIPEAIDEAVSLAKREGKRVKLAYVQLVGNPDTSQVMTEERGKAIVAKGQQYGFGVLEDRAYDGIVFDDGKLPPPLIKYDPYAIYGGTFSKTLAPGLRVGWLVVPSEMMPALRGLKLGSNLSNSALNQIIVAEYAIGGKLTQNLPTIRAIYQGKRDVMHKALDDQSILRWKKARGGMFVLAENTLGLDTEKSAAGVLERGRVVYLSGVACAPSRLLDGYQSEFSPQRSMRLNFTNAQPEMIPQGVQGLVTALQEEAEIQATR